MKLNILKKKLIEIIQTSKAIILNKTSQYPNFVLDFENKIEKYFDVKHCLTFSNGTTAAKTAMIACGMKNGSKVAMSKLSFPSVITSALQLGAQIKFLNFDKNLQILDLNEKTLNDVDFIIITHAYGFPQNMKYIFDKLKDFKNIKIIEDISHSQGGKFEDKYLGTLGNASFMSMQGSKAISAGEGGLLLTNSTDIYEKSIIYSHINRKHFFKNTEYEKFSKLGLVGKGRAHPLGILSAHLELKNLRERNENLQTKYKKIYDILSSNKNVYFPKLDNFSDLGGFHYGLPFFSQNEEFLKKISKISTIVKYNWPPLDEFEIFRDSNKFDDFLQNLNLSGDLKTYKDHRSQLHFIDLQWIINNSLNKIIKKLKTL